MTESRWSARHCTSAAPYTEQLRHFVALVQGLETPVCSADDGLRTLEAALAVTQAAAQGAAVVLQT